MSISTRLEAINQHLLDDYSVLTLGGADLTNVDKNIQNLKTQWKSRLEYYLANGLDVVWNNWNKITGSGTSLTLNNTIQAPMKIVYGGNTYQYSTQGYSLYDFLNNEYTTETQITVEELSNGFKLTNSDTSAQHRILFNNVSVDSSKNYVVSFEINNPSGQNVVVGWAGVPKVINTTKTSGKVTGVLTGITSTYFSLYCNKNSTVTFTNIMLYEGTDTTKEYEPYTGGMPAPNSSYPYPVQVVSGNNSIKVEGKNLFDKDNANIITNYYLDADGNETSGSNFEISDYIKVEPNTIYSVQPYFSGSARYCYYDNNKTFISSVSLAQINPNFTTPNNCYYIRASVRKELANNYQIEKNNQSTTYTPYVSGTYPMNLGSIELCKIGDYQDRIYKLDHDSKNLYNGVSTNEYASGNGTITSGDSKYLGFEDKTKVQPNTTYTIKFYNISSNFTCWRATYDSNGNFIERISTTSTNGVATFTTGNNVYYVFCYLYDGDASFTTIGTNIQLNEGSTALPYEPYGTEWYKYGAIGKVVLDGSENQWQLRETNTNTIRLSCDGLSSIGIKPQQLCYSSYFKGYRNNDEIGDIDSSGISPRNNGNGFGVRFPINIASTLEAFKTWLSTHNTTVYYVLSTPTYTKITDQTLIYQLEQIKYSYNEQTNISQTNNDMPFILDVSGLTQLS